MLVPAHCKKRMSLWQKHCYYSCRLFGIATSIHGMIYIAGEVNIYEFQLSGEVNIMSSAKCTNSATIGIHNIHCSDNVFVKMTFCFCSVQHQKCLAPGPHARSKKWMRLSKLLSLVVTTCTFEESLHQSAIHNHLFGLIDWLVLVGSAKLGLWSHK